MLRFKDWRHPLDEPHVWTPLFFLDDAVALAAGHRPCATCRRADYVAYRDARRTATGRRSKAVELDRRLASERLRRGRGLSRAQRPAAVAGRRSTTLPVGTVVVVDGHPHLVGPATLQPFTFAGWGPPPSTGLARSRVLTPPTSVAALAGGFRPTLHRVGGAGVAQPLAPPVKFHDARRSAGAVHHGIADEYVSPGSGDATRPTPSTLPGISAWA